ncbi:MAG TPA: hypothetical protein PKW14_02750 [Bacteroidota bacterium]|jgi:hypothetical protein|nr:hypothetical protein [Bacteroidota bacterium]
MKKILFLLLLTKVLFCQSFPDYDKSLNQSFLDLSNQYVLLFVNLKPGDEDINTLFYLRNSQGFKVYNLFLTRGETEEETNSDLYNEKLAAKITTNIDKLFSKINIQNYYLNFKISNFYREKDSVIKSWGGEDTILHYIKKVLNIIKPDIVFINNSNGKHAPLYAPYYLVIKKCFNTIVQNNVNDNDSISNDWKFAKLYIKSEEDKGDIDLYEKNLKNNKFFKQLFNEYKSIYFGIKNNFSNNNKIYSKYNLIYSSVKVKSSKNIVDGLKLDFYKSDDLLKIIKNLTSYSLNDKTKLLDLTTKADAVVDYYKYFFKNMGARGDRVVSNIKYDLSVLKYKLLNINILKSISDSAVCKRQLLKFTIDTIENIKNGKKVITFYSINDNEWVLMRGNDIGKTYDIKYKEPFIMVTPDNIRMNYPKEIYQYDFLTELPLFEYAITFKTNEKNKSFQYFGREFINVVEQAHFEIFPHFRFIKDSTEIGFNLTHFLNDPLKNIMPRIMPEDSIIGSFMATKFSVYRKYDNITGRILFKFNDSLKNGNYKVHFTVGQPIISDITFKKFNLVYDSIITVGLFTEGKEILDNYFTSLKIKYIINPKKEDFSLLNTIIIDENLLFSKSSGFLSQFNDFVKNGGNLIVLKQDKIDTVFFNKYFIDNSKIGFGLLNDNIELLDEKTKIFSFPNKITPYDFKDWNLEFSRSLPIKFSKDFNELMYIISDSKKLCGLLYLPLDKGSIFYVPLSLKRQLLTVEPSAYKLLSNLISFKKE